MIMGSKSTELFDQMKKIWDAFVVDHTEFAEKQNKQAGKRARMGINDLKKLVRDYRKTSVEECKQM